MKLLYDFAVAGAESAGSVCFVCVDVHSSCEVGVYAAYNVAEEEASAVGLDLNGNHFLVRNAESFSISGSEVDVSLCGDNAFFDFNFAAGANDLALAASLYVAGLTNGSFHAEGTSVCQGDFNLSSGACRSEDDYVGDGLLRSYNGNSLFASELTGLGQVLLMSKGSTLAEQDVDVFCGKVNVTCAGFNKNFVCHDGILRFA